MDKFKDMFKISDRDKHLLLIALAVLIVFLAYFFGYSNLSTQVDEMTTKKTKLESTRRDLKDKTNNRDKYIEDTETFEESYKVLLDKYDTGSTQPNTIEFFNKTEAVTGTWVRSLSISEAAVLYKFGELASTSVDGVSEYTSDLTGYKTTISISYEADYSQWKKLIKYINTYASKSTIEAITAAYNQSTGMVTGTASIALYSIEGTGQEFTEPSFDVKSGTSNIFSTSGTTTAK